MTRFFIRSAGPLVRAGRWILDTVLPPLCPGCGEEIASFRWICGACRHRLRSVPSRPVCFSCRTRADHRSDREAGMRCERPEHAALRGGAALWMEPPLDAVVHALKYGGVVRIGAPLGRLLARAVRVPEASIVVPLPLHRTRRRERGYNQAAVLARGAAAAWGIPMDERLLVRDRATRAQARLGDRAREANVSGAFRVTAPERLHGRTLILIDDVATTGNTLLAAAGALHEAGAARVVPLALALA